LAHRPVFRAAETARAPIWIVSRAGELKD